ncbi:MAG: hypothetical protein F9K38_05460 [Pseudorhodoplanes sp.]|nr:MAG: hypothetical protein F9K38_05460 [Pseudorhodoplanes sp.]
MAPEGAGSSAAGPEVVGRGIESGARMFREWFDELTRVANAGGGAAYVFVIGSFNEILQSFDMPVTFPEMNSLQTAIRRVSSDYLTMAEDYGYSSDVCGYVKADLALQLKGGAHPMGRVPKPSMAVLTNGCNTYIKWAEIWERLYGIPVVTIDIPGTRSPASKSQPGSEDFAFEQRYVLGQIKELIAVCEYVTKKKFDIDKFREVLSYANEMSLSWQRVVELNQNRPAVYNAMTDGTVFLGVANAFRGTKEGAVYFADLVEEMEYRVRHGIGVLRKTENGMVPVDQKFRLSLVGTPCYPIFRRFDDMFAKFGGIFVYSSYMSFGSGGTCAGYTYDLDRPLESFAATQLLMSRDAMDSMFHQALVLEQTAGKFAIDGVIFHPIKSCRTVSTGMADQRRYVTERLGLPTLILESDFMDPQVISEAQMKNRVDAFFEGLISRRHQSAA